MRSAPVSSESSAAEIARGDFGFGVEAEALAVKQCAIVLVVLMSSCSHAFPTGNNGVLPAHSSTETVKSVASNTVPSDAVRKAVILAIEDDITKDAKVTVSTPPAPTPRNRTTCLSISNPLTGDRKNRMYHSGLATLSGHPEWNFPSTTASRRTVFLDDDTLCQLKHDSVQAKFSLSLPAIPERLRSIHPPAAAHG